MTPTIEEVASLGRIYDPLAQLAQRICRAVSARPQTICTDGKGRVFACTAGKQPASHAIVGTYAAGTPAAIVERDLRHALRERASEWIVDWDAQAAAPDRHHRDARIDHRAGTARARRHPVAARTTQTRGTRTST